MVKISKLFFGLFVLPVLFSALLCLFVFFDYLSDRDGLRSVSMSYQTKLYQNNLPSLKSSVFIYDKDGNTMGEFSQETSSFMTMKTCGQLKWLNKTTVVSEDSDFFEHGGVSYRGILRALVQNIISLRISQGGGSITQQLARNLFTKRNDFKLTRKIYETYASFLLEGLLSKKEILCLYLNKIYMGEGRVGARNASLFYFQKYPEKLDAAESAMLVGLFPAPSLYSPLNNIEKSLKKQNLVLDRLVQSNDLSELEKKELMRKFYSMYHISISDKYAPAGTIGLYGNNPYFKKNYAPSVNEYIRLFLLSQFSFNTIAEGLNVYTTIDLFKQKQARLAVTASTKKIRRKLAARLPQKKQDVEIILNGFNGVFIALHSGTWNVQAMVSGFSHSPNGYINRATQMFRQPGSAIKGLLYALAIQNELIDKSILVDEPINFNGYSPRNWYRGYRGALSLEQSIAISVNTIPVKLLHKMGVSTFREMIIESAGFDESTRNRRLPSNLTLALGSGEVSPMELASIYATILNLGVRKKPRLILRVEDFSGNILFDDFDDDDKEDTEKRVISEKACIETINLLRSTIEHEEGTSHWLAKEMTEKQLRFPVAAKTGTVQGYPKNRRKYGQQKGVNDIWFVTLQPYEVDLIWFGHDRGVPFPGSGGSTAAQTWLMYASRTLKKNTYSQFPFAVEIDSDEENKDAEPESVVQEDFPLIDP